MILELALESLRNKTLIYKSLFERDTLLSGIFEFDTVLGGINKNKKYLIVGQEGCCPLLLTNTLIDNMAFLNKKSFSDIAKNIKPKLLKSDVKTILSLDNLDKELIDNYEVIIAVYRPEYFDIDAFEDDTFTDNTLEFKILKGAEGINKSGKLFVDILKKNINSFTLRNWFCGIRRLRKKDNRNSFECLLSAFIRQEDYINLSPDFQLYFKDKIDIHNQSTDLENYQIVFTNEPQPQLVGYCLSSEKRDFGEILTPEFSLQSVSLDNIINLLALFSNTQDFNAYYNHSCSKNITNVIENHLKNTNQYIIFNNQLELILKSYTDIAEDEISKVINKIIGKNDKDIAHLNQIILENGLGLIDQINHLLLPSRQLYEPKLLLAQKIYNYLRVNEL